MEAQMNFNIIFEYAPLLLRGVLMTVFLWCGAAILSLAIGTLFGVLRCRTMRINYLTPLLDIITWILRGVPFYVQLLIVYFVLPNLLGLNLSPSIAGIISLGLCSAAYVSQMIRGSINAIADNQWEAAWVLGLNKSQSLQYVILPQAMRTIIPMICGELDMVLKSTSVISTIGVLELTGAGRNILAINMQVVPVYCTVALLYLFFSSLLNIFFEYTERRLRYDAR
jgi:His/Glu/Gln/Arg/opine family amino acid ABC transporter permease subunit